MIRRIRWFLRAFWNTICAMIAALVVGIVGRADGLPAALLALAAMVAAVFLTGFAVSFVREMRRDDLGRHEVWMAVKYALRSLRKPHHGEL